MSLRRRVPAVLGVLALLVLFGSAAPAVPPGPVHFAAAGDYNDNSFTAAVLEGVAAAAPDLNLALGDLSYGVTGAEQAWCDFVSTRVGAGFPFELVSGNHESNGQNGNINDFSACLPNQLPGVVGTYGRQYFVDVPHDNPTVRFVMISPNLPFTDGTWNYYAGTPRYAWTSSAIDGARSAGIPWVVVGMHKPCLSVGQYTCEPGADLTNLLLAKKVDLVLTGHEHLYQRTKQLALRPGCPSLSIGAFNAACVADSSPSMAAGAGTVFATVGTGGSLLRDVAHADPEAPYFAALSGANSNPAYGFLDVTATADSLTGRFVGVAGATFADSFSITAGVAPPNTPPTAAFTTSTSALSAAFDGAGSSDPDGSVTTYGWTFGDGQSATGVTANHTYAAAGTYDVTLTVTDDDGATNSLTRAVSVTAVPPPTILAADDFERVVATGWGTAPTGGLWSGTGGAASGVAAGTGRLTMAAAGAGPTQYLAGVSSTDTDFRVALSLDKAPLGGASGFSETLYLRRLPGQGDYRVALQVQPSGACRLTLSWSSPTGALTTLATQTVPGLTFTAGNTLILRAQATGTSPTTVRARVWRSDTTEPAVWNLTATNSQAALQAPGSVGLQSYLSSSVTNAPIVSRYDNLRVARASTLP